MKGPNLSQELIQQHLRQKMGQGPTPIPYVPTNITPVQKDKIKVEMRPKAIPVDDERTKKLKELNAQRVTIIKTIPLPYYLEDAPEEMKLIYQDLKYSQTLDRSVVDTLIRKVAELELQVAAKVPPPTRAEKVIEHIEVKPVKTVKRKVAKSQPRKYVGQLATTEINRRLKERGIKENSSDTEED